MSPFRLSAAAALGLALWAAPAVAAPPATVATILPVHSIVSAVMAGVGEPHLLIDGAGSPHAYSLKPSDARALEQAGLVVWVGEGLETFLERPLATLSAKATVLTLEEIEGIELLPIREGGAWEGHAHDHAGHDHKDDGHKGHDHKHDHKHDGHKGHDHGEGAIDTHLWLDPMNGKRIAAEVAETLSQLDPANADAYRRNAETYAARLDALDAEIEEMLHPVEDRPYVVFHDAYQYFEAHYGLNARGAVTLSPDRAPGAERLREVRHAIEDSGAACIFAEPQFSPRVLDVVTEGLDVKTGVLDPLGAELAPGPDAYPQMLRNLAVALKDCLG